MSQTNTGSAQTSGAGKPKILFTTVCRPIGPKYGDAPSVGYELLHGQVTRAQGIFSPRATHHTYGLDFIAANISAPSTVLHYPSRRELIRELKRGKYDYVGISFILATYHHMKRTSALIRKYAPDAKIILGGYGTVMPQEKMLPYGDFICKEEGVGYMRRLLGEAPLETPFKHPAMVSTLKVFSKKVSSTGMIFAGLGCPNGCDFCCTSHFFKRKHIKLLPTGREIYAVIRKYLAINPAMQFTILDEDFLLDKKRAGELRDEILKGGVPVSIFAFSSVKALSMYTMDELLETGIDGFWIGYEGTRSGYGKQQGRPMKELFEEIRSSGGTILSSMIVGFDYQTPGIIKQELDGLLALRPALSQFLIYNFTPGTPLAQLVQENDMVREEFKTDADSQYRASTGFVSMIKHPRMAKAEIERMQKYCFEKDYQTLGPSIYRAVEAWFNGYVKYRDSASPFLRRKAEQWKSEVRKAYPVFFTGKVFAPNSSVRKYIAELERRIYREVGKPKLSESITGKLAVLAAAWTKFKLSLGLFQHPKLQRNTYNQ
jgi:haloalkane dehalogenase